MFGGAVAVGYQTAPGWFVRIEASGSAEPDAAAESGILVVARVCPGLAAGFSWRWGIVGFAPGLLVRVPISLYRVALETRADSEHWRVNLSFHAIAELTFDLHDRLCLVASAAIGSAVFRDRFKRTSDESIEQAALVEARGTLGARLLF